MIWVTGVPRTGSKSIHRALEILGYKALWACVLTNRQNIDKLKNSLNTLNKEYDAIVANAILSDIKLFYAFNQIVKPEDLIILTKRRNTKKFINSLENFGLYEYDLIEYYERENILRESFPSQTYDFSIEDGWEICNIIGSNIPKDMEFPVLNQLPINYSI